MAEHRAHRGILRRSCGGDVSRYSKVDERVLEGRILRGRDGAQGEEASARVEFGGEGVEGRGEYGEREGLPIDLGKRVA